MATKFTVKLMLRLLVGTLAFFWMIHSTDVQPHVGLDEGKPDAHGSTAWVIDHHDCWTGSAPVDVKLPGHVVVIDAHGDVRYSARLVGPALDSLFNGKHVSFQVAAFCR